MAKKENLKPDRMRFYFRHTSDGLPRITVCLAILGDQIARGVSLCSFKESVCVKRHGKFLARNRALRAFLNRADKKDVIQRQEAHDIMHDANMFFLRKSDLNPVIREDECEILFGT